MYPSQSQHKNKESAGKNAENEDNTYSIVISTKNSRKGKGYINFYYLFCFMNYADLMASRFEEKEAYMKRE